MAPLAVEAVTTSLFLVAAVALGAHPAVMLGLVLVLCVGRVAAHGRGRRRTEVALFGLGVVLGGLNDWISVDVVGLYRYEVPSLLPGLTTVPEWMWLGWGLVLRLVLAVAAALDAATPPPPRAAVRSRAGRALVQLVLVVATRQAIYRLYDDPWLSWLPFALALVVYALALGLDRREQRLALVLATVGPLAEVLFISVGGVHRYALGWIGGVPVWIVLWWVLGALVWKDAGAAVERWLMGRFARRGGEGGPGRWALAAPP